MDFNMTTFGTIAALFVGGLMVLGCTADATDHAEPHATQQAQSVDSCPQFGPTVDIATVEWQLHDDGAHVGGWCGKDQSASLDPDEGEFLFYGTQSGSDTYMRQEGMCANGCVIAPSGHADYCNVYGGNPCITNAGWYCGRSIGMAIDDLYYCDEYGAAHVVQSCGSRGGTCVKTGSDCADYCAN
jgi:hypothetical protein